MLKSLLIFCFNLLKVANFYFFSLFYSVLVICYLVWSLLTSKDYSSCWKIKERPIAPSVLTSDEYGEHKFIQVNGVKLHYVEKGDKTKPLMLFVHGFPEFWYSWRYQLKEFSKDYRTIAIDLRGYGESDKPNKISEYHIDKIVEDIRQLVLKLDCNKFILVAHDYGGVVSSKFVLKHMEMIDQYILICTVSLSVFEKLLPYNWYQFKSSWYVFLFQMPFLPEFALKWNDFKRFKDMDMTNDLEPYKYTFGKMNALTGPVNYYRANAKILYPDLRVKRPEKFAAGLLLLGELDIYIHRRCAKMMMKRYDNMQFKVIKNANHFAQQHQPEETNRIIREFLKQNQ